ncbi:cytochrome o ubiquinol oxidase subunit IV [Lichenicoccus roseus]|uniref:Cytochrome bo(3) ubiquinol oxidase subunit 4 n=1 Tax=Lichenicoccus roseus TaxID=2683649 RepID=A0A5R9JB71_9PROT|nr:cytochrome o ubiquinol oxidase subunit IV [Lichenicoccus roseus]TLU73787.1 cytochrome o ubiquinol oxidase subunit IV [Lichenicoccus roseus]
MADMNRAYTGESHGSVGSYGIGFVLSIILTGAAFGLVMEPVLPHVATLLAIAGLAAVQVFVHLFFFLHMNGSSEQRWNVTAFAFAVLTVAILIVGSLWIMHNISENMMPGVAKSHMPAEM